MKTRLNQHLQANQKRAERLVKVHDAASKALRAAITEPDHRIRRGEHGRQFRLAIDHRPKATPEGAEYGRRGVTLSTTELHILLAAALPTGRHNRTRTAHARVTIAMQEFEHQLATLTSTDIDSETVTAAQALQNALDHWLGQAARAQAAEIKRSSHRAQLTICAITRHMATSVPDLPSKNHGDTSKPAWSAQLSAPPAQPKPDHPAK